MNVAVEAVVTGGWIFWVCAVLMAGLVAQVVWRPRRLCRRLDLLTGEVTDLSKISGK